MSPLVARVRSQGAVSSAARTTVPTEVFGRWLHRARAALPVPLTSTWAATVPLSVDEVVGLTEERRASDVTTVPGMPPGAARTLTAALPILTDPQVIAWMARSTADGDTMTVAGLLHGGSALLLIDTREEVSLQSVAVNELAQAMVRALPATRGAYLPSTTLTAGALEALADVSDQGLNRVHAATGVDPEVLRLLQRLHRGANVIGLLGAMRRGGQLVGGADWYEGRDGAVLKRAESPDRFRFEAATRSALTSALVGAVAAA